MTSGWTRRGRAWIVTGIVAAGVVAVGGGPAPGQVSDPEIAYLDAYGPIVFGYEDCERDIHTEVGLDGAVFIELADEVEADVQVGLAYTGSLADDIAGLPLTVEVPAGDSFGYAVFEADELEEGDLTVTALPGLGYTAGPEDTYTVEVSDDPEIVGSCFDDLGDPPSGTDRQTIFVGERPLPLGFLIDEEPLPGPEPTLPPPTDPSTTSTSTTTTTEVTTTTEDPTTTSTTSTTLPIELEAFSRIREQRVVPEGYDTPVANGTVPPGLAYVDDVWSGAATTPGTYAFDVRVCFDQRSTTFEAGRAGGVRRPAPRAFPDVLCLGAVDVVVEVRALERNPAAPADAVDARANFAG